MINSILAVGALAFSFSTVWSVIVALLVLLFMITVHEFGHYSIAKLFKFKVNEFAIGMGPALYKKTKKNGEIFSVRLLPLGGYCAFEGEDSDIKDPNAFNNKKPWQRILVLVAGATMNFLVAMLIFIISFCGYGQMCMQAYEVKDAGAYTLQSEDVLLALNGKTLYISTDIIGALKGKKQNDIVPATVYRKGKTVETEIKLQCDPVSANLQDYASIFKSLGIATLTGVSESANDNPRFILKGDYLLRSGSLAMYDGDLASDNGESGYFDCYVYENGDKVKKSIKTDEYYSLARLYSDDDFYGAVKNLAAGDTYGVFVSRDGERLFLSYTIKDDYASVDKNDKTPTIAYFGIGGTSGSYRMYNENVRFGFFENVGRAVVYTFKTVSSTFAAIGQIFSGSLSITSLSGPVSTISLTSQYVSLGFNYLLEIAGFIGVSLAIFNLLPIPALDGARVVFVLIEWIRKKPVPRKIEGTIHAVGLLVLLAFAVMVDLVKCF